MLFVGIIYRKIVMFWIQSVGISEQIMVYLKINLFLHVLISFTRWTLIYLIPGNVFNPLQWLHLSLLSFCFLCYHYSGLHIIYLVVGNAGMYLDAVEKDIHLFGG